MITLEEFEKVEIRIGTVLEVVGVPEADKLLKLIFDFGSLPVIANETKQSGQEAETAASSSVPRNDEVQILPELVEKYPGRDVRQVMSAIRPFFADPQVLVGKQICVVTNLEPRKFRGYLSQGMITAVGDKETEVTFIVPENPVAPGTKLF
jgi:methionyl-tRNA synthetase